MKTLLNIGCGTDRDLPEMFRDWRQLTLDIDPRAKPDLLGDMRDLAASVEPQSVDAVWASHCLEHVYAHEVSAVLRGVGHALRPEGFLVAFVPDIQAIASFIAEDRLDDVVYKSPSGPVTAHDMIWGFRPSLERGHESMAHKCGFTPTTMMRTMRGIPWGEVLIRRVPWHELVVVASLAPGRAEEIVEQLGV